MSNLGQTDASQLVTGATQAQDVLLVSGSDIFALGHYPGNPIYPGVLTAERLCQLCAELASAHGGAPAYVKAIKRIQYLDAILPGDVVSLTATIKKSDGNNLEIVAAAAIGDKVKTRATIICAPGVAEVAQAGGVCNAVQDGENRIEHRQVGKILPHRYPFLLVDRIEDYKRQEWVRATKIVNRASPLFLEQMPQHYPQGLMVESIGQAGIALFFLSREDAEPVDILLGSITEATFDKAIPFGSAVTLEAKIERLLPNGVVFSGSARIGDQVTTKIGGLIAMIDPRK